MFLTSGLRTVMFPPRDPKTCGLETSTCASAARYKSSVWQGGLQEAKVVQELLRHASFKNDDGWLHAGIGSTQTPGTSGFGGSDHALGQGWTRMNLTIVLECCGNYDQDASKLLILWRPRRDLNPCYRRERAMS